jgi:hypothetical protein
MMDIIQLIRDISQSIECLPLQLGPGIRVALNFNMLTKILGHKEHFLISMTILLATGKVHLTTIKM